MENKKDYPLFLLHNIDKTFQAIRDIVNDKRDLIYIDIDKPPKILIKDIDPKSDFYFQINNPVIQNKSLIGMVVVYDLNIKPKNKLTNGNKFIKVSEFEIPKKIYEWASLIKEYNNINLSVGDKIFNKSKEEFYNYIKSNDEDANNNSFDLEIQLKISLLLEHSIKILNQNPNENKELIDYAIEIKESIPNDTKNEIIVKLSKFFAKVKTKSLDLLGEIFKEGKSMLIQKGIGEGSLKLLDLFNTYL